jgi:hypothetical protein
MAAVASAGAVCPEPLMTLRSLSLFLSRPFWPVAPLPSAASPTVRERERERERVVMDASLALGRVRARQDPWAQATWAQAYTCTGLGEGPAACARPRRAVATRAVHVGRLSKELAARCAVLCVAHEPQTRVEVSAEVSAERRQRRGAQHAVCPW